MATSTVQAPPKAAPQRLQAEQRLVLSHISWQTYRAVGAALADRPSLRLTYDRGNLEFMTTSSRHEIYKKCLSRFIDILAEEFNKPKTSAGNMTFQEEGAERGLEADDCFWILHEPHMRGKLTWDPRRDPPPDLVLEIEVSRSALDRLGLYAALRVLEIWRFDGVTLHALRLLPDGTYQSADESQFFPKIPLSGLLLFLAMLETADDLTIVRQFRAWVREVLAQAAKPQ